METINQKLHLPSYYNIDDKAINGIYRFNTMNKRIFK